MRGTTEALLLLQAIDPPTAEPLAEKDDPEMHVPTFSRSGSWLREEHLCCHCSRFLQALAVVYCQEIGPVATEDVWVNEQLCYYCAAVICLKAHCRQTRVRAVTDIVDRTREPLR